MTKAEVTEVASRILDLRRAARPGAGPMAERRAARERANTLFLSIPKRDTRKIPAWFWSAVENE